MALNAVGLDYLVVCKPRWKYVLMNTKYLNLKCQDGSPSSA